MEFVSSDATAVQLSEQLELLRDACDRVGIALPTSASAVPPEAEAAVKRHIELRQTAFSVVPRDMRPFRGDPLRYVDPWLTSRATDGSLAESEVDSNALLRDFPRTASNSAAR